MLLDPVARRWRCGDGPGCDARSSTLPSTRHGTPITPAPITCGSSMDRVKRGAIHGSEEAFDFSLLDSLPINQMSNTKRGANNAIHTPNTTKPPKSGGVTG